MPLFGKKKIKTEGRGESAGGGIHSIKILSTGCLSCDIIYGNVKNAVRNMGLEIEVEYVSDLEKIMSYEVISVPALVINDEVISEGKALKPNELEKLLGKYI